MNSGVEVGFVDADSAKRAAEQVPQRIAVEKERLAAQRELMKQSK